MKTFLKNHLCQDVSSCQKSALAYVEKLNWSVFPLHHINEESCTCGDEFCNSPAKHPRIVGGFKSATKNKLKINEWWSKWPRANIGIATGKVNQFIVMDIDQETMATNHWKS